MLDKPHEQIDLSGTWQITFDPENEGVKKGWSGDGWQHDRSHPIQVPQIWNIDYPDAEGVGFYRTVFTIPDTFLDQVILLRFSGVIYACEVWVNGKFVGGHEGGYTPFEFDITRLVHIGYENFLVVRVAALSKSKEVDGIKLQHSPLSKQSWYYVYGGIWGRVFLESCPRVVCQSLIIDPNLKRESVQLNLCVVNRWEETRQVGIHQKILDPHGTLAFEQISHIPARPGLNDYTYSIRLSSPMAWSCEQPDLYCLEIRVIDEDGQVDSKATNFGMRDFTVRDGLFILNGEPFYIRGVILQPNFPIKLIEHTSREMMVREITLAKEAGFNMIRSHLQPPSPEYLDLTDQMGILVYAETSLGWILDNPCLLGYGMREIQAMIALDRNHPSVVFWGIYNENPAASAINGAVLAQYARTLDPTRVIVEDSGASLAIDQDFGWIDRAAFTPAWEAQPQRILDMHLYLGSPTPTVVQNWMTYLGTGVSSRVLANERFGSLSVMEEFDRECRSYPGQIFVSELGCGGMADLDEQVANFNGKEKLLDARELKVLRDSLHKGFQERHLERIFGSVQQLFREAQELQVIGNTQQVEALLSNPRVSGYMITQLNDVSWEFHAGLLDLWRNPKPAYFAFKRLNQPNIITIKTNRSVVAVSETISIEINLINRIPLQHGAYAQISVYDPTGLETDAFRIPIPTHTGIHPIKGLQIKICKPGSYRIAARLILNERMITETSENLLSLENVAWDSLLIQVRCLGRHSNLATIPCISQERKVTQNTMEEGLRTVLLAAEPATLNPDEWNILLEAVKAGQTAIVGALWPENNEALNAFTRFGLNLKLHPGIGSWMGCYHWAPQSDLFMKLPAGGLLKQAYTEVLPKYVLSEMGGEVLAGSFRNTQSRQEAPAMLWYSDIENVCFGKGMVLFCQYRIFENMSKNPLADRMVYNLLAYATHFSTRL